MRYKRILCFILSLGLVLQSTTGIMAEPINNQGFEIVLEEDTTLSENSTTNDFKTPTGFISLGDDYVPDVVTTNDDFESDISLLSVDDVSVLGDVPAYDDKRVPTIDMLPNFISQGGYETCWAIATATACQISAEADEELSAPHMAYYFYNKDENTGDKKGNERGDYTRINSTCSSYNWKTLGSNVRLAMWELASWMGLVSTSVDNKYKYSSLNDSYTLSNNTIDIYGREGYHVQNVYMSGVDSAHRDNMKELIERCGAVTVAYYATDSAEYDSFAANKTYDDGYETSYGNYYVPNLGTNAPNHQVVAVGWDDNYSKDNFVTAPSSDGAWLIMNSWGNESNVLAQNGLFWLSYEDAGLLDEGIAVGFEVEGSNNYDNIYQYDGSFGIKYVTGEEFVQFFSVNENETLAATSIGTKDADVNYTVNCYQIDGATQTDMADTTSWFDFDKDDMTSDGSVTVTGASGDITITNMGVEENGTFSYPGYHTVTMSQDNAVLSSDSIIAVVYSFEKPTSVYKDIDYTQSGAWDFYTNTDEYLGIYRTSGSYAKMGSSESLRIKLFTNNGIVVEPTVATGIAICDTDDNGEIKVNQDDNKTLTWVWTPSGANDAGTATWSSSDPSIVSIDSETGEITAKKIGEATITCSVNSFTDTCKVVVEPTFTGIKLDRTTLTLKKGTNTILEPSLLPSNCTDRVTYTWKSSDTNVATVSSEGKITAVNYGTATISCSASGKSATCSVTVNGQMTGLALNKSKSAILKGRTVQLIAEALPSDTTDEVSFTWTSEDPSIATVSNTGLVTGIDFGTTTIKVKCGAFEKSCVIEVTGQISNISLDKHKVALRKGAVTTVKATLEPEQISESATVTYSSSNGNIATIDASGKITAKTEGTCTITATCKTFSDTCEVYVDSLKIKRSGEISSSGKTKVGNSFSLDAAFNIQTTTPSVTWKSSNTTIATIDNSGNVTAIKEGAVTLTATTTDSQFYTSYSLTVEKEGEVNPPTEEDPITVSVSISNASDLANMYVGDTKTLTVSYTPSTLKNPVKTYTTSNSSVVEVSNTGVLTAKSVGTALIKATVTGSNGTGYKTVSITVKEEQSGIPTPGNPVSQSGEAKDNGYTFTITNFSELGKGEVGKSKKISKSMVADETHPSFESDNVTYQYEGDGTYLTVSSDGTITFNKAGTGWYSVTATVDKTTLTVYSYVSITLSLGNGDDNNIKPPSLEDTDDKDEYDDVNPKRDVITKPVDVTDNNIYVKRIVLSASSKQISKGGSLQLTATSYPTNTTNNSFVWYSSNSKYATVDVNGLVKAKKAGAGHSVVITCKPNDGSKVIASYFIRITKDSVKKISLYVKKGNRTYNKSYKIKAGKSVTIKAKVDKTGNDTVKTLVWTSSNPAYATVNGKGKVTTAKAGKGKTVKITCMTSDGSKKATYKIKIKKG